MILRMVLSREPGIEVVAECQDGREAIHCAQQHQPSIVLLDLNMPVMNGLEALPEILAVSPESRVIVMSGFKSSKVEHTVRELGAVRYIEKGENIGAIVQAIKDVAADNPDGTSQP